MTINEEKMPCVLKRGGYETGSYLPKLWSGPLKPGLEDLFASAVVRQPGG